MEKINCNGSSKGQYFSFDAITATVIFVIGISLLSAYWLNVQNDSSREAAALQKRVLAVSDMMLTSGFPANWNDAASARQFGLAQSGSGALDLQKISALGAYAAANYSFFCERLSLSNAYISMYELGSTSPKFEIGRLPSDPAQSATAWRVATYNGRIVQLRITGWTSSSWSNKTIG